MARTYRLTVFLALALPAGAVYAQLPIPKKPNSAPAATKPAEQDPLGRTSPHGCVLGFLRTAERENYAQAAQYLDWSGASSQAQELARQLQAVLNYDRGLAGSVDSLSRSPEGNLNDGLRNNRERVGYVQTPSGKLEILLDRVARGEAPPIWLFSAVTLQGVPKAFGEINTFSPERYLPRFLIEHKLFSFPLWRWLGIIVSMVLVVVLASLVTRALIPVLRSPLRRMTGHADDRYLLSLRAPIRMLLLAIAIRFLAGEAVSLLARVFWTNVSMVLGTAAIAWLVIQLSDVISDLRAERLLRSQTTNQLAVQSLLRRFFKILVLFAAVAFLLRSAGVNVSAMLAGLGIGGIALALAAQKTLEDLFGGITIISRKAVRIGDFCKLADQTGTIEDIGLESMRLRTPGNTVVTIPNGKVSQMSLENYSMRQKILFHHIFGLRSDTSPAQMRQVLAQVTQLLHDDSRVERESSRIRLIEFGASSLQVETFAYIKTNDNTKFLEVQEDLMLHIMDIIAASGTSIALPSQITYFDQGSRSRTDFVPDESRQTGTAQSAELFAGLESGKVRSAGGH